MSYRAMVRAAAVLVALAGCTSDAIDRGTPLAPCQECGPGAVLSGRFFSSLGPQPVVGNRSGTVERVVDGRSVAWLRDDFTIEHSRSFGQQAPIDIALDEGGGGAVTVGTYGDFNMYYDAAVIGLAPDHSERWRVALGDIVHAQVVASSELVLLQTDAAQIGGATISTSPSPGTGLVALRVQDGSIAWHKPIAGDVAVAADGSLIVSGTFAGTLDLGGTAMPLTATGVDAYVATIDPLTGNGRWARYLDVADPAGPQIPPMLGVGSAGEIAFAWKPDPNASMSVSLMDAGGTVRWTQPVEPVVTTVLPDGDRVLTSSGSAFSAAQAASFARYSASGLDWQRVITGTGRFEARVLALPAGRLIGSIFSKRRYASEPAPTTSIGDVTYEGEGVAIVELAH